MSKPIFYEGQEVGCLMYGEGVVNKVQKDALLIKFKDDIRWFKDNGVEGYAPRPTLYPIDQYRSIIANLPAPQLEAWKPKPGEWCLFGTDKKEDGLVLRKYRDYNFNRFYDTLGAGWHTCYPFTGELPEHLKEVQP